MKHSLWGLVGLVVFGLSAVHAGDAGASSRWDASSGFVDWWNGPGLSGDWLGGRGALADRGLTIQGRYLGAFFGILDSQGGAHGVWDQALEFGGEWNAGKFLNLEGFEGVKAFGAFRWRDSSDSANPNRDVAASGLFAPSTLTTGTQFRVMSFGVELGSAGLLPVRDMVVLRGGWLQPAREFIDQPLSKMFLNNAVVSARGVGGNVPLTASFSTWGGTLRLKPAEWLYAKAGLFMAYPHATDSSNHGLAFAGYAPDPSLNGLLAMGEVGVTPRIGAAQLPGRYAFGGYSWGNAKDSFNGTPHSSQFGFYWQADQMVYREPSAEDSDGKSFREPVSVKKPALSEQGLSLFSLFTFAPEYNNLYPFYFHAGLSYRGLIPGRDKDQTLFVLAHGQYSRLIQTGPGVDSNFTTFLEGGYRIQVNPWAFVQPFAQYIIRPDGSDAVRNAAILGVYVGVDF